MKVWICGWDSWESGGVAKVYDNEEKAKEWLNQANFWFNVGKSNKDLTSRLGLTFAEIYKIEHLYYREMEVE